MLDPRHYVRLAVARSILGREQDEVASSEGIETIGKGEGGVLVVGVPAQSWSWGELSFQLMAGELAVR